MCGTSASQVGLFSIKASPCQSCLYICECKNRRSGDPGTWTRAARLVEVFGTGFLYFIAVFGVLQQTLYLDPQSQRTLQSLSSTHGRLGEVSVTNGRTFLRGRGAFVRSRLCVGTALERFCMVLSCCRPENGDVNTQNPKASYRALFQAASLRRRKSSLSSNHVQFGQQRWSVPALVWEASRGDLSNSNLGRPLHFCRRENTVSQVIGHPKSSRESSNLEGICRHCLQARCLILSTEKNSPVRPTCRVSKKKNNDIRTEMRVTLVTWPQMAQRWPIAGEG